LIKQARPNPATQVRGVTAVEPKQSQASDEAYLKVLSRLYDLLLAPVLPVLKDTPLQTSILVVPDGPLQLLPFEMLGHETKAGWRWAGSDFVFREYSSAMMLLWWRLSDLGPQGSTLGQQPKPSTEMKLLAFGDPVYNAAQTPGANRGRTRSAFERAGYSFPALPGTRIELMNVGKTFGLPANSSDLKLGPLATKSTLKRLDKSGELKHYRYLHFATHGILANDVPGVGQPALVLSLTGNSDSEGFLTMEEVEHLQLRADLVTLSACQTGLGRQITGEGTMGMARAFVVAGAPSVIVSLWSVSDESTAKLMQLFYTHLVKEHRDKGTALQMAREELRKQYPNPYYWAPFILIGEK
jgi:CHAT domain-containing protein